MLTKQETNIQTDLSTALTVYTPPSSSLSVQSKVTIRRIFNGSMNLSLMTQFLDYALFRKYLSSTFKGFSDEDKM